MNKPLTAEEAKNLTFPCLLEVWNQAQDGTYDIISGFPREDEYFLGENGSVWFNAALPSPEIAEAMRKQFAPKSEYPKRMLVWNDDESKAQPRIVIADLGEKAGVRYIVVFEDDESKFENGEAFSWCYFVNAKHIPDPDPEQIAQEIAELRQRLADLEAKHSQQA